MSVVGTKATGKEGGASLLCPGSSGIDLFGDGKSIVHLDAEISDSALDFAMPEQELDGT